MNQWSLIAFVAWSAACGFAGYKAESWHAGERASELQTAQQQVTMAAQGEVIKKIGKADAINFKAEEAYEKDAGNIDALYRDGMQQASRSTGDGVRPVAGNSCPAAPKASKKYRLTYRQCDTEESKLIALTNWYEQQRAAHQ